jgi:Predicted metal-binding integral membrane protein (DUF2182)
MMESTSKALGAGLLLIAGLFQFSRVKYACLAHCRSPMGFLATEWRDGSWGAFRMGLKHGGYCLGCCWALMGVLFAFGVMNLLWVACIGGFVLLEKIASGNQVVSHLWRSFVHWLGSVDRFWLVKNSTNPPNGSSFCPPRIYHVKCYDVDILVCPGTIQKSDILLSTKNIAPGNGQSGQGNLLGSKFCWWLASSDTRSGKGRLQEALASDSTPSVDSGCYRRYRLQQLIRSPETLRRIFVKEFLKENDDRLWNIFESFTR